MTKLPRVTLKLATSLDGKIATSTGHSKWITGPEARRQVHELRARHDAILTGVGTVLADDPQMTARGMEGQVQQPMRIVLDSKLRTPKGAKILADDGVPVWVFHGQAVETGQIDELSAIGVKCVLADEDDNGRPELEWVLSKLSDNGVKTLMVEAGSGIATSFLKAGLVDRIDWFRAPLIIGDDGLPAIGGFGLETLNRALRFVRSSVRVTGDDVWETYEKE